MTVAKKTLINNPFVLEIIEIVMINCGTVVKMKQQRYHYDTDTSTSNPFLCAADFFLQLASSKEAGR